MPYYAYHPSMDPTTGDVLLAGPTWLGGQPLLEIVLRILRTERGTYAPDPTLGVRTSIIQKATHNVQATWRAEVISALARLTRPPAPRLLNLGVDVDPPRRGRLFYVVRFRDARDSTDQLQTTPKLAA